MTSRWTTACLVIALSLFAVLGLFARLESDDFCELLVTRVSGPTGLPSVMYATWSGRFALFSFKGGLYALLDEHVPALAPALLIVALTASLTYALRPILKQTALTIALVSVTALLLASTNPLQLMFWASGSLMVITPLILALLLAGLIQRQASMGLIGGVAALSMGFNEPFALVEGLLLLLWAAKTRRRAHKAALAGAAVGLLVTLAAPGNSLRATSAITHQDIRVMTAMSITGRDYLLYLQHVLLASPLALALPFVAGWWLRPLRFARHRGLFCIVLIGAVLVAGFATLLIVTWAGVGLGARHEVVVSSLLIAATFCIGSVMAVGQVNAQSLAVCAALSLILSLSWMTNELPLMIVHSQVRDQGQESNLFAEQARIAFESSPIVQTCKLGLRDASRVSIATYPPTLIRAPAVSSSVPEATPAPIGG